VRWRSVISASHSPDPTERHDVSHPNEAHATYACRCDVSKGRREVASRSALIRARHHDASDEAAERLGATVAPHSGVQHRHRLMLKGDDDLREVHAKARRAGARRVYSFASFPFICGSLGA
jgi:hypothetical protein